MQMQSILFVERNNPEWDYMWHQLADLPLNKGQKVPTVCLNSGEGWQYMGTSEEAGQLKHCFRHRCHPVGNSRVYVHIVVSPSYQSSVIS